ncbi:hypothetical protein V491_01939, partial [Pseudogymnoascus sp. VKM F-3775]
MLVRQERVSSAIELLKQLVAISETLTEADGQLARANYKLSVLYGEKEMRGPEGQACKSRAISLRDKLRPENKDNPFEESEFMKLCLFMLWSVLADLLVPCYEAPVDVASNKSHVAAAWRNATATLHEYITDHNDGTLPHVLAAMKNITFSVGLFSLDDPAASKMQFHYTSPEIANAPNGTNKVDGNTIYRMASVTKAFTVLAGLLELNSTHWDRPITDFVPTLANYTQNNPGEDDPTHITEWDKVTLSALAAQIAGVPRDPFLVGEITDPAKISALGLPPLNPDDPLSLPPCALPENYNSTNSACNEIPTIESIQNRPPGLLPWTSPAYANTGFVLLGVAIANITGKPLTEVYRESIFEPLGMTSSNASTPPKSEWHR